MKKIKLEWDKIPEIINNKGTDGYGLVIVYHMREDRTLNMVFNFHLDTDLEITNDLMREMCQEAADVIHKYLG